MIEKSSLEIRAALLGSYSQELIAEMRMSTENSFVLRDSMLIKSIVVSRDSSINA
jgi:hypothetical protein